MSAGVEELLREGINRLTAEAKVPPGLADRARRHAERRDIRWPGRVMRCFSSPSGPSATGRVLGHGQAVRGFGEQAGGSVDVSSGGPAADGQPDRGEGAVRVQAYGGEDRDGSCWPLWQADPV
jgi:hypothetical protein